MEDAKQLAQQQDVPLGGALGAGGVGAPAARGFGAPAGGFGAPAGGFGAPAGGGGFGAPANVQPASGFGFIAPSPVAQPVKAMDLLSSGFNFPPAPAPAPAPAPLPVQGFDFLADPQPPGVVPAAAAAAADFAPVPLNFGLDFGMPANGPWTPPTGQASPFAAAPAAIFAPAERASAPAASVDSGIGSGIKPPRIDKRRPTTIKDMGRTRSRSFSGDCSPSKPAAQSGLEDAGLDKLEELLRQVLHPPLPPSSCVPRNILEYWVRSE